MMAQMEKPRAQLLHDEWDCPSSLLQ